jgi:hypothetical protein
MGEAIQHMTLDVLPKLCHATLERLRDSFHVLADRCLHFCTQ